jgi:hypothetical protein
MTSGWSGLVVALGRQVNNLATLYEKQDRHSDAEPLFRRALAIYEKAAGPEHPAVATLLSNLGLIRRQTVSVLPSVASLKALRAFAHNGHGARPMTGFGDPLFDPEQQDGVKRATGAVKVAARSVATSADTDFWRGAGVDRAARRCAFAFERRRAVVGPEHPKTAVGTRRWPADRKRGRGAQAADWVVLSACNTIAGDKPGAEALSGLARAFF